jgi:hypothetical protein
MNPESVVLRLPGVAQLQAVWAVLAVRLLVARARAARAEMAQTESLYSML